MNVLISWSGVRSQKVAAALREWLPCVFQSLRTWMSSQDIGAGTRWADLLSDELEATEFGILCLTTENRHSPWMLFEAGAISKSVKIGRVVPYLIGLSPADIDGPLSQFQAVIADKEGTRRLLHSIRDCNPTNFQTEAQTERSFLQWWPDLEQALNELHSETDNNQVTSDNEYLQRVIAELRFRLSQFEKALDVYPNSLAGSFTAALGRFTFALGPQMSAGTSAFREFDHRNAEALLAEYRLKGGGEAQETAEKLLGIIRKLERLGSNAKEELRKEVVDESARELIRQAREILDDS